MRTHEDIMKAVKVEALAEHLGKSVHTVRSWRQRKSIPVDVWPGFIAGGFATIEELSPELAEVLGQEAPTRDAA